MAKNRRKPRIYLKSKNSSKKTFKIIQANNEVLQKLTNN